MVTGKCKHGEFELTVGCEKCISERQGTAGAPPTIASTAAEPAFSPDSNAWRTGEEEIRLEPETALIKVKPELDLQVMAFYTEALELKRYAEARVIKTLEDMKPANDDLNIIRKLKKNMEARRKEYLAPFQDHVKEVNEAYKNLMEPVDIADKITTDKMLAFNREQDRIRKEQETINRMRMEAAQKDAALHNGEISEPVNLVAVIPEAPKRTTTDVGSTGQRDTWKWEVVDITQVPREYLMVNAGMLTPIVKASKGKISIPGIRIYNEPILAVR